MTDNLRIDIRRLQNRLEALAKVGALPGGGVCRLALSDEDRAGRDLVVSWMRELGLAVTIDRMGNVVAVRAGLEETAPVMTGSHIDTVATGGIYDGNLGVLAGLEAIECLNDAGIVTRRPLAVAFFTNEEGVRFTPDMMGSLVHQGDMAVEEAHAVVGTDGTTVGDNLRRIGYLGDAPCGSRRAEAFVELHIEQGPILEQEGIVIGAVEGVQGISWTEITFRGTSNHAGTTPMSMRRDAGYAAFAVGAFVRRLAGEIGSGQVATAASIRLRPNLINVIANQAVMTVDLRNMDEDTLKRAEARLHEFVAETAAAEGVDVERRALVRFAPVDFDPDMIGLVEETATKLGHSVRRMPSGAGHDAQMFARHCPTSMIFVPSVDGISHNVDEYTAPEHLEAGANVLLQVLLAKSA